MIGERLGRWVLDRELGRGGMGRVFLAHEDPPPSPQGRLAAVKVLAVELGLDAGFLHRFQTEIAVLRKLDHPNIVHFYDSGAHGGRYYYAMEYVEGRGLDRLLHERGRAPWQDVLDFTVALCPALKHAHDRGVIHRDLKPSNILVTDDGVPKLTDFGVARVFANDHLTIPGGVVGTPEYLSPEQAAGKPVTRRSDLYSLGAVLYTLLTGRTPFHGESVPDLLHKHLYAQFDRPRQWAPDVPHEFDEVVCQLLEKDPSRRPADAGVLGRQLESLRRKLRRKSDQTIASVAAAKTQGEAEPPSPQAEPGPATLMSQLLRQELDRQNRGGPVRQFLNRPAVLATLLVLCGGALAWGLWPSSAEGLYRRGAALMASEDPDDWERAWDGYLRPLEDRHPGHPYRREVDEFRRRVEAEKLRRQAARHARLAAPVSEAQWFYQRGLRLRQQGNTAAAEEVWRQLAGAFEGVEAERPWVELARQELAEASTRELTGERRWAPVRAALERARRLRDEGRRAEAEEVWAGIERLYRDDPSAGPVLEELRRDRSR